jgi:hypothetical protein
VSRRALKKIPTPRQSKCVTKRNTPPISDAAFAEEEGVDKSLIGKEVKCHARSGKVAHTYVITRLGRDEHGGRLFNVVEKDDDDNGDVEMAIPKTIMAKMMKRCDP